MAKKDNIQASTTTINDIHDNDSDVGVDQLTLERKIGHYILNWFDWRTVCLILAIKFILFLFGTHAYYILAEKPIETFTNWLSLWNRWDAMHYVNLAENGYQSTGENNVLIVFYPVLPWAIRLFNIFTGNYILSGLIVIGIASVIAGLLLKKLVELDFSQEVAKNAVWFMFIFPTSYFLHVPYTESLFLCFALGSFLAARTDKWLLAGILGAAACLSRTNGLVLIPALIAEAAYQFWKTRQWKWSWLWIGLVGLGVAGYLLLNYHVFGNPFQFMIYRREHWFQILSWPWEGIISKYNQTVNEANINHWLMVGNYELFFIAFSLIATIWACIKLRPSYAVWMICNWILSTSTSFLLGVPRFVLIMFPIYILLSVLTTNRIWFNIISVLFLLFLALCTGQYVRGHWAF